MGLASVRLLSAPAADTPGVPPVVLTLDAQRYLFNIGEGTTRTATQRRLGAKKCANLFVSRVGVECTGGLPGECAAALQTVE